MCSFSLKVPKKIRTPDLFPVLTKTVPESACKVLRCIACHLHKLVLLNRNGRFIVFLCIFMVSVVVDGHGGVMGAGNPHSAATLPRPLPLRSLVLHMNRDTASYKLSLPYDTSWLPNKWLFRVCQTCFLPWLLTRRTNTKRGSNGVFVEGYGAMP